MKPYDINNENYHVGHLIFDTLKKWPDAISQIDAATGESETYASVLTRSIQLAKCFRKFGAKPGDVLALGGRNHLDLHIPYYAALMNGLPIAGVDPQFKYNEIRSHFKLSSPKIAFCQKELLEDYLKVIGELGLKTRVICYDDGPYSLKKFIEEFRENDNTEFEPVIIDLEQVPLWLVSTGGTTGVVKLAVYKHKPLMKKMFDVINLVPTNGGEIQNLPGLNLSPVQWLTGFFNALSFPVMKQIKVQTSAPATTEHVIDIINKYKPASTFFGPSLASAILKSDKKCDLSSLNAVLLTGGKVHKDVITELKKRMRPNSFVIEAYGQTENFGPIFKPNPFAPLGSCGKDTYEGYEVKLVDPETEKPITIPNEHGELWVRGGPAFAGYYNDPKETAAAFSEDGWYKTGDILCKDENGFFYFVDRFKMMIKYRNYHIIPPEIEEVIRGHPGVLDVSVTSVPHREDGEHAVACVVKRPGANVTAQEIKDLVASKLSDAQHLRGGVVFMDEIPLTSSGKVARAKLRQIVVNAHRE